MSILLSREAILSSSVPTTEVEVPEWNGSVRVRALSAKSRILLLDAIYSNEKAHTAWKDDQAKPEGEREGIERVDIYDQSILTVLYGAVDEENQLVFSLEDYPAFLELDYMTIVALWSAIKELTARDPLAVKKNSGSTMKGGSSSGSRNRSARRSKN